MSKRQDIHRPSALITEDYDYLTSYDAGGDRRHLVRLIAQAVEQGYHFDRVHGGDTCDHCGTRLRYVAILKHEPTKTMIKVGEQCLDNRFDLATDEFHRLRTQARLSRERTTLAEKYQAWLTERPENGEAMHFLVGEVEERENHGFGGFYFDLLHKARKYGSLSEAQVDAVLRARERDAAFAAKRAAEQAQATAVIQGRIQITGEVLSVKFQENAFGGRLVMTVRDERGFKVWGTVPGVIDTAERGDQVTFTATIKASDRDETFGFYSRPTKAQITETADTATGTIAA